MNNLGLHLPGGLPFSEVAKKAQQLNLDVFQFCMHTPNQLFFSKTASIEYPDIDEFANLMHETVVINHSSYMVNLASSDNRKWGCAKGSLKYDLKIGKSLGVDYNVVHGGSYGEGYLLSDGVSRIVSGLEQVLTGDKLKSGSPMVLLENTAGKGTSVCGEVENMVNIKTHMDTLLGSNRVGICLDTCHAWAHGYDLFDDGHRQDFINNFGDFIDLIHFNSPDDDCPLGSGRDRHKKKFSESVVTFEQISRAYLDFKELGVPMIIERMVDEFVLADFTSLLTQE